MILLATLQTCILLLQAVASSRENVQCVVLDNVFCITSSLPNVELCNLTCVNNQISISCTITRWLKSLLSLNPIASTSSGYWTRIPHGVRGGIATLSTLSEEQNVRTSEPIARTGHMAGTATYQVSPPEQFNFTKPEEWPKWARRFERFRKASGLAEKDEETQVNTLVYSMGDEADDIPRSFRLSEEDAKKYDVVKNQIRWTLRQAPKRDLRAGKVQPTLPRT